MLSCFCLWNRCLNAAAHARHGKHKCIAVLFMKRHEPISLLPLLLAGIDSPDFENVLFLILRLQETFYICFWMPPRNTLSLRRPFHSDTSEFD
jgi:hypothetical protein